MWNGQRLTTEWDAERAMEKITSRKNEWVLSLRRLAKSAEERRETGQFLCDGHKLLREALDAGMEITSVLWKEGGDPGTVPSCSRQAAVPEDLFDYVSPMTNSPGPLFTVRMPHNSSGDTASRVIVLENVQDPGNVGTVIRTANAMNTDAVVLTGACADPYSPKTVRATMGAIFRQRVIYVPLEELPGLLSGWDLPLYGALLSERARNILTMDLSRCAVAVGSEGNGLSRELQSLCTSELIIPMNPASESLNAAVAASIIMWEMRGRQI